MQFAGGGSIVSGARQLQAASTAEHGRPQLALTGARRGARLAGLQWPLEIGGFAMALGAAPSGPVLGDRARLGEGSGGLN
jgi:hypothetical protein